ncbi:MAG: hypothetical protein ACK5Q2_09450, partial [Bacteroidota bacterium]
MESKEMILTRARGAYKCANTPLKKARNLLIPFLLLFFFAEAGAQVGKTFWFAALDQNDSYQSPVYLR